MDISIGSSSSSYKSERSKSSPRPTKHRASAVTTEAPLSTASLLRSDGDDDDTRGMPAFAERQPEEPQFTMPGSTSEASSGSDANDASRHYHTDDHSSDKAVGEDVADPHAALFPHPSADALSADYVSRDSFSPRLTRSNSAGMNPSFASSSVSAPPPLPPLPHISSDVASDRLFKPRVARYEKDTTATFVPSSSDPFEQRQREESEEEKARVREEREGGDDGYLRRVAEPAAPSTPPLRLSPPSPPPSAPSAFARTESPSPLRKLAVDAEVVTTPPAGSGSPSTAPPAAAAAAAAVEGGGGATDSSYQPMHLPALKSPTSERDDASSGAAGNAGAASDGRGSDTAEARSTSEVSESFRSGPHRYQEWQEATHPAAHEPRGAALVMPVRMPPPLPRPTAASPSSSAAAGDPQGLPTSAPSASPSLSRLPSRSAPSKSSAVSLPRAAEPRRSLGRAGEEAAAYSQERAEDRYASEREGEWGDSHGGAERATSLSAADAAGRAPSHAPTVHRQGYSSDRPSLQRDVDGDDGSDGAAVRGERRGSSPHNMEDEAVSLPRSDSLRDEDAEAPGRERRPPHPHDTQSSPPLCTPSPSPSASASSALPSLLRHSSDAAGPPAERRSLLSESLTPSAPAAVASRSDAGLSLVAPQQTQAREGPTDAADHRGAPLGESPPPLPPAPWKSLTRDFALLRSAAGSASAEKASPPTRDAAHSDRQLETPETPPAATTQEASSSDHHLHHYRDSHARLQDSSALQRWRAGERPPNNINNSSSSDHVSPPHHRPFAAPPAGHDGSSGGYRGGVDFVRWVPTSVDREANLSRTPLTPARPADGAAVPHPATEVSHLPGARGGEDTQTTQTAAAAAAVVVAVPLVPSPHRRPNRSATTAAVLAEVAQRRASTSAAAVPGGVTVNTSPRKERGTGEEAAASSSRPRLRLSALTSAQRTRAAEQAERSYMEAGEQPQRDAQGPSTSLQPQLTASASAASRHLDAHSERRRSEQPRRAVDTWGQQQSGRFLAPPASRPTASAHALSSLLCSDGVSSLTVVDGDSVSLPSSDQAPASHLRARGREVAALQERPRLGDALSRSHAAGSRAISRGDGETSVGDGGGDDTDSAVPSVVRAWRPQPVLLHNSAVCATWTPSASLADVTQRQSQREEEVVEGSSTVPVTRWTRGGGGGGRGGGSSSRSDAWHHHPQRSADGDAAAALSIHHADDSMSHPLAEDRSGALSYTTGQRASGHTTGAVVTPGYAAVYSPRTLASQVLHARHVLLHGTQAPPHHHHHEQSLAAGDVSAVAETGAYPSRQLHLSSAQTSFVSAGAGPHVAPASRFGSRVVPAIGAAVAAAAAASSFRADPPLLPPDTVSFSTSPPPLPHVRVNLAYSPLHAPPMPPPVDDADMPLSYAEPRAAASAPPPTQVGTLAQQQSEKVALAMASEPWSLFMDEDSTMQPRRPAPHQREGEADSDFGSRRRTRVTAPAEPAEGVEGEAGERGSRGGFSRPLRAPMQPKDAGQLSSSHHPHRSTALSTLRAMQMPRHSDDERGEGPVSRSSSCSSISRRGVTASAASTASQTAAHASTRTDAALRPPGSPVSRRDSMSTAEPEPVVSAEASPAPAAGSVSAVDYQAPPSLTDRVGLQAMVLAQQRILQEEAFRRRQVVMQEEHTIAMEVTEMNYQRAVAFVKASMASATRAAVTRSEDAADVRAGSEGGAARVQPEAPSTFVGLSGVRLDQAAMARSLLKLSQELDQMAL